MFALKSFQLARETSPFPAGSPEFLTLAIWTILPRRLQPGRPQPLAHMRAGLALARLPEQLVSPEPGGGFGLFAEAFGLLRKPFFERQDLFESTSTLHDTTSEFTGPNRWV